MRAVYNGNEAYHHEAKTLPNIEFVISLHIP